MLPGRSVGPVGRGAAHTRPQISISFLELKDVFLYFTAEPRCADASGILPSVAISDQVSTTDAQQLPQPAAEVAAAVVDAPAAAAISPTTSAASRNIVSSRNSSA